MSQPQLPVVAQVRTPEKSPVGVFGNWPDLCIIPKPMSDIPAARSRFVA
jgi:hypothetical protein